MGKPVNLFVSVGVFVLMISLASSVKYIWAFELPVEIPGDYEGKWYGIHCPDVPREKMKGVRGGEVFPNQTIMNSWGYKAKTIDEIKALIPEFFYEVCSHPEVWGDVRINETAYIPEEKWGEHVRLKLKTTEKHKGAARLNEKGHLESWVAGYPFPGSEKGIEIAWNFVNSRNYGEGLISNWYQGVVDRNGHRRYASGEQCYLWWKGRLYGEHTPHYKPNPNNYEFFSSTGFYSPYDLYGMVGLTYRYDDPDKQDDMWMYITSLRRVRRMSTSQRWDKIPGGTDLPYDALTGFQGKPTNYEWRYLGKKELLCPRQPKDSLQEIKKKPMCAVDQLYQRVNTVVLEYKPKEHMVAPISRAVMYLDPEMYACFYVEFFDKKGRPYLFMLTPWVIFGPGYQAPIGFVMLDLQRVHGTTHCTYDEWVDEDATEIGGNCPSYFEMTSLRRRYSGR